MNLQISSLFNRAFLKMKYAEEVFFLSRIRLVNLHLEAPRGFDNSARSDRVRFPHSRTLLATRYVCSSDAIVASGAD